MKDGRKKESALKVPPPTESTESDDTSSDNDELPNNQEALKKGSNFTQSDRLL